MNRSPDDYPKMENVWKALNEYGIYTEEDLDKAIAEMPPLNLSCMMCETKTPMPEKITDEIRREYNIPAY